MDAEAKEAERRDGFPVIVLEDLEDLEVEAEDEDEEDEEVEDREPVREADFFFCADFFEVIFLLFRAFPLLFPLLGLDAPPLMDKNAGESEREREEDNCERPTASLKLG